MTRFPFDAPRRLPLAVAVIAFATLVGASAIGAPAAPASPPDCSFDRQAMLALDYLQFDETKDAGWRVIAHRPGCELRAADLLELYRDRRERQVAALAWHEGQLRAAAGETERAIALFESSREKGGHEGPYIDASVAFLRHDRAALLDARRRLAAMPEPEGFRKAAEAHRLKTGEELDWPLNLAIVDGLIACFDRSYDYAYGHCRGPAPPPAKP
jgi:hypothetical protein